MANENKKDYYEVLGVAKDASEADIKRAYRKLAAQYHPDVNHEPGAEARFKEINEANEVLSDPDKRARYDQFGFAGVDPNFNPNAAGGNPFGGFGDFGDLGDIFGDSRGRCGADGVSLPVHAQARLRFQVLASGFQEREVPARVAEHGDCGDGSWRRAGQLHARPGARAVRSAVGRRGDRLRGAAHGPAAWRRGRRLRHGAAADVFRPFRQGFRPPPETSARVRADWVPCRLLAR